MRLEKGRDDLYTAFYDSTIDDGVLNSHTKLLVGLSTAIALNCSPCTGVHMKRCKALGITKRRCHPFSRKSWQLRRVRNADRAGMS